jgi:hypothetical protein
MRIINFNFIKRFVVTIYNSPGHNLLLQNAVLGNINSQYNLAKFYLKEMENYVEAYAWAEVACYRNHPYASNVKLEAQEKLSSNQIKEAWMRARDYKLNFC